MFFAASIIMRVFVATYESAVFVVVLFCRRILGCDD